MWWFCRFWDKYVRSLSNSKLCSQIDADQKHPRLICQVREIKTSRIQTVCPPSCPAHGDILEFVYELEKRDLRRRDGIKKCHHTSVVFSDEKTRSVYSARRELDNICSFLLCACETIHCGRLDEKRSSVGGKTSGKPKR